MIKLIIFILIFSFSQTLLAMDKTVFQENYPTFQEYQEILFSKIRDYFERLPQATIINSNSSDLKIYSFYDKNTKQLNLFYSKITRKISDGEISEKVTYSLSNGTTFTCELLRKGVDLTPTDDNDLLTFNFKLSELEDFYQVTLPESRVKFSYSKNLYGDKAYFDLGFMDFKIQTESFLSQTNSYINYIFFYKYMPNPQASLTARAISTDGENIQFIHTSSQAGELTPKQFFEGLNTSTTVLEGVSDYNYNLIIFSGFPNLD